MDHISACIQEVMESYEVTFSGKTIPIKAINNVRTLTLVANIELNQSTDYWTQRTRDYSERSSA